jgi:hypothetical protein
LSIAITGDASPLDSRNFFEVGTRTHDPGTNLSNLVSTIFGLATKIAFS